MPSDYRIRTGPVRRTQVAVARWNCGDDEVWIKSAELRDQRNIDVGQPAGVKFVVLVKKLRFFFLNAILNEAERIHLLLSHGENKLVLFALATSSTETPPRV